MYKAMDLFHGLQNKRHNNLKKDLHIDALGFHGDMHLVIIRLPNSWVLKLMTRALLLSLVILSLPWLNVVIGDLTSKMKGANSSNSEVALANPFKVGILPLLFRDLANEGLLKMGDRALSLSNAGNEDAIFDTQVVTNYNMDMISYSDFKQQSLIPEDTYDFMFAHDYSKASTLMERTLKIHGIAVVQLDNNPMAAFQKPSNFKIVYLRRFDDSTIMAMRKMNHADNSNSATKRRRLLGLATETKRAALSNLEDVLLEPPRAASGKSNIYHKRTRYLPDLIGDSLESYPRRVFIDVSLPDKNDAFNDPNWFPKHYPTKNTKFEIYKIETVADQDSSERKIPQIGMSDWVKKNVKENEYVVMKAEAEVVEEMVRSKAIRLVDELFLECKHRDIKKSAKRSRRAYWECLALYGMLRDEGIAVHQWWG